MSRSAIEYLRHIFDEAKYLINQAESLSYEEFQQNLTLQRAFVRSLEIIGEAAKQMPESVKAKYSDVEWRAMAGMRDKLIHHYFGVDYEIVWDVVTNKIPVLFQVIRRIIEAESTGEEKSSL
ncbi:MAG: DUF86 domain-containing protein [Caldilineae bacterium]|nr:MAG: DUF86 domain-containing protein [Caldilineae bacterium]